MNEKVKKVARVVGQAALKSGTKAFGRAADSFLEDLSSLNEGAARGIAGLRTGFRSLAEDLFGREDDEPRK
jgi:hypothetical protein